MRTKSHYLTPEQAAELLDIHVDTLNERRELIDGPAYSEDNEGNIYYTLQALENYEDEDRHFRDM